MPYNAARGIAPRTETATTVASGVHSTSVPPALVLGTGIAALGVIRSLGRAGIPQFAVSASPGPARASRWYRAPLYGDFLHAPDDLPEYLHRSPLDGGVLIPATDHDALAIARLPDELKARFPSSLCDESVLASLVDKGRLLALLETHGVPHPRTVVVESHRDVHLAADLDPERAFIKPRDSEGFMRRFNVRALRPSGPLDLRAKLDWLVSHGIAVVVQEYVPGPPDHHHFVDGFMDGGGTVRARLGRRALRMFPVDFGDSSAATTVRPHAVSPAIQDLERLLDEIGYRGPYSAEFKVDERDGTFRLLGLDARPWWCVEFAARCGVDVIKMTYRDALGLPVMDAFSYPDDRKLVRPLYDAAAHRALRASGHGGPMDYLRSLTVSDLAVFAADDPLPGIADLAATARRTIRGWIRKMRAPDVGPPPRQAPLASLMGPAAPRRLRASPTGPGTRPSGAYPRSASLSSRPHRGGARWS